jgi:hypothetical protein
LLFKVEEKPDGGRSKPKLAYERSSNLRAYLRTNKENDLPQEEVEDEVAPFRNMIAQRVDKEKLQLRNQELES